MNVVFDGACFQLGQEGVAEIWASLLPPLIAKIGTQAFVLDRGQCPPIIGANVVPFPGFSGTATAEDSRLIQRICDHVGADVFVSTYYTTPLTTPSVAIVYDPGSDGIGGKIGRRMSTEKGLAIRHACRHVCISEHARREMLRSYPWLEARRVEVVDGFDRRGLLGRNRENVAADKTREGRPRPDETDEAAVVISGDDPRELAAAVDGVRDDHRQTELSNLGLHQAARFEWDRSAEALLEAMGDAVREARTPGYRAFAGEWARLRAIQGAVDVDVYVDE